MKPLSRRFYAMGAVALAAVIFLAVNIAADGLLINARLDLTENGQFTLAQGTRNIIAKLREPIRLKLYYSKKVAADYAQTAAYAGRVRDLLHEYAALSHGKIVVEEVEPEPYTAAEDEATSAGLTGAPTDSGDVVYFGLVGSNSIDGKEVIPYFATDREPYLEYDLTSLIYRLSTPKKPVLGVLSSLPLEFGAGGMAAAMQGQAQPFAVYQALSQNYATQTIDPAFAKIPANVDVLMIVHPGALNDQQLYAIDQFALSGGRVLVFVDPYSELAQASGGDQQGPPPASDLAPLFRAWGIAYSPNKVVGDKALAQRVQTSADARNPVADYPVWLHLTNQDFDSKDTVTANLQTLNLASVGALHALKGAMTVFVPLVRSSEQASLLDAEQVRFNSRPQDLMGSIRPTGERYAIAARLSGLAHSAFPRGAPSGASGQPYRSSGNINVVVMADSDIFDDRFWVRVDDVFGKKIASPFADNGAFILNAVENLTGSSDLISLRTRATNDRPFTVVRALQAQAQGQFQQEEQILQQRLSDTQARLRQLQEGTSGISGGHGTNVGLTQAQQREIERFKREMIETRAALREVQHNLRKDIDALGAFLTFINIALVPILVAGFAVVLAALRRRRRARALPL